MEQTLHTASWAQSKFQRCSLAIAAVQAAIAAVRAAIAAVRAAIAACCSPGWRASVLPSVGSIGCLITNADVAGTRRSKVLIV